MPTLFYTLNLHIWHLLSIYCTDLSDFLSMSNKWTLIFKCCHNHIHQISLFLILYIFNTVFTQLKQLSTQRYHRVRIKVHHTYGCNYSYTYTFCTQDHKQNNVQTPVWHRNITFLMHCVLQDWASYYSEHDKLPFQAFSASKVKFVLYRSLEACYFSIQELYFRHCPLQFEVP
jgi:hypothetical protein